MTAPEAVAAVLRISVVDLRHGPNARGELGDVTELAQSLLAIGQQLPLIVERRDDGSWQVFDGNRRLKAARQAKLPHLLCIPRNQPLTDVQRVVRQLSMHATGKGFNPIAEAKAVEWLLFEDDGPHLSREEIARMLGRSPAWVKGRIDLLQLAPDEQESVAKGSMSVTQALGTVNGRRSNPPGIRPPLSSGAAARRCTRGGSCGCVCHKRNQGAT